MRLQERESEADSEEEASEDDSRRKQSSQHTVKSCRINYGPMSYRDLNEQLNNLDEVEGIGAKVKPLTEELDIIDASEDLWHSSERSRCSSTTEAARW